MDFRCFLVSIKYQRHKGSTGNVGKLNYNHGGNRAKIHGGHGANNSDNVMEKQCFLASID